MKLKLRPHLLALVLSLAAASAPPAGAGYYSERPRIEDVAAAPLPKKESDEENWPELREGAFRFLAELLAFYPNHDFNLLARDGEYMYDLARLLLADRPAELARFRLVNISTKNRETPLMPDYLEQEVLGPGRLSGRKQLTVDTGLEGKIHNTINELLARLGLPRIDSHFMSSAHREIPSSRVAADPFVELRGDDDIAEGGADLAEALEEVPHYTAGSTRFARVGRRLEAESVEEPAAAARQSSLRHMADIRAFAEDPRNAKRFFRMVDAMRGIVEMATGARALDVAEFKRLDRELKSLGIKSFLLDLREATYKGLIAHDPARLQEFWNTAVGRVPSVPDFENDYRTELAEAQPELAGFLEKPKHAGRLLREAADPRGLLETLLEETAPIPSTRNAIVESVFSLAENAGLLDLIDRDWVLEVQPAKLLPALQGGPRGERVLERYRQVPSYAAALPAAHAPARARVPAPAPAPALKKEAPQARPPRQAPEAPALMVETLREIRRGKKDARYGVSHSAVQPEIEGDRFHIHGREQKVQATLGDGARARVVRSNTGRVYKLPFEPGDSHSIEIELRVTRDLADRHSVYGIDVAPILEAGPDGSYLEKAEIPKAELADRVLKAQAGRLTAAQLKDLKRIWQAAGRYALETGIGLDIKSANLYWRDGKWWLLEAGPRMSENQYGFTLDARRFDDYLAVWTRDEPRHSDRDLDDGIKLRDQFLKRKSKHPRALRGPERRI